MKTVLFIALLSFGSILAQESTVKKVAMLQPQVKGGNVTPMQKAMVCSTLSDKITSTNGYEAFTRTDIDAVLNEQKFQRTGVVTDAERIRMGKLSGATIICVSSITLESGDLFVEASLIDVETGKLLSSQSELMNSTSNGDIKTGCAKLADKLLGISSEKNSINSTNNSVKQGEYKDLILVEGDENFKIGRTEVTNAQYAEFLNAVGVPETGIYNGNYLLNPDSENLRNVGNIWQAVEGYQNHPMVRVTWYGATEYCKWVGGRLPTEKEWKYAAKGGNKSLGYEYSGSNMIEVVAWYHENSRVNAHKVATKLPNELGIYDMSGNVHEWCMDWYDDTESSRVTLGGGWYSLDTSCKTDARSDSAPTDSMGDTGFRVCVPL